MNRARRHLVRDLDAAQIRTIHRERRLLRSLTREEAALPVQQAKSAGKAFVPCGIPRHFLILNSNCGTTRTPLWRRSPQGTTICNACGLYQKARNTSRPLSLRKKPPQLVPANARSKPPKIAPAPSPSTKFRGAPAPTYVSEDQAPPGTCPGGGKCNGTGGAEGCGGCPAYNNRLSKTAQLNMPHSRACSSERNASQPGSEDPAAILDRNAMNMQYQNTTVVIACQNCGTTTTPLWRRDEGGHTICNACGECAG